MIYNDVFCNILCSYAYLYKNESFNELLFKESCSGSINVMIDSGAFTKFNASAKNEHINLNDYCTFLRKWGEMCEKYVMLDVVGQAEQSRRNYEEMLSRGFNPMFVCTMFDNDFAYIAECVKRNPNICVAGGVTTKSDWMTKRFQDVYKYTGGAIHGLGYVTMHKMFQLPLKSVDSSTWSTASNKYGMLNVFCGRDGFKQVMGWTSILKKRTPVPKILQEALANIGVTPKIFCNPDYHRGSNTIAECLSTVENLKFQRYAKNRNLDYFLAVGSKEQLQRILWCRKRLGNIDYLEYRDTFKK